MTREQDDIHPTNKIVVTVDICSSSIIIEDLLKRNNIKLWRNLLIKMKEYLTDNLQQSGAKIHKFIGDGWIILFDEPYSARNIFQLLEGINKQFDKYYTEKVFPTLDTPPEISGITFGIDEGQLIKITMQDNHEYIGRPINIACRLQGAINEIDIKGGYRVFISHRLYNVLKDDLCNYYSEATERSLKNISECSKFRCYRLVIADIPFRIIEARYGTDQNMIDVTSQYTNKIKHDKLDEVVSNVIAENDPHRGVEKILKIKYVHNGKLYEKECYERARIQIP